VLIVDSHCHASPSWYEPVESLGDQMERNSVEKAVLVQHRGAFDNSYLLDAAKKHPGRFAGVVLVDVENPGALKELERCAKKGAVGVRLNPQDRSPGQDPLAIWKKASALELTVSVSGQSSGYSSDEFEEIVAFLPRLTFVLEHLAAVGAWSVTYRGPGEKPPYPNYKKALALSRYQNTFMKVGGLGEICERPPLLKPVFELRNIPPFIDMALEAFGPKRLMWGSDFPPVCNREGYKNALQGLKNYPALKTKSDREWIMGKAAFKAFKLT